MALTIISEISKGADFKFLAMKYATDEIIKKTGGDMGWIKYSLIPESYKKSFVRLEKKIGMLQEGPHWTILYIADIKPGDIKPFEKVRTYIYNEVMAKEIENKLNENAEKLRKTSKIIIYKDKLKKLESSLF